MRMAQRVSRIVTILVLVGWGVGVHADIPRVINFQGRLSDASGTPLSGPHTVVFRIFDQPTLGTACFTETQSSVPVNSGLFKVNIGTATGGGIGGCTFASAYYLEVQVDNDAPMTPRLALTAAAYAFSTDRLDGLDSSDFQQRDPATGNVTVSGKVGVGTASPAQKVDALGFVKANEFCIGAACRTSWPVAGTLTEVAAGTGISLSPSPVTGAGTISVNTAAVQSRVTGTCGAGSVVRAVNQDGSVACQSFPGSLVCYAGSYAFSPGIRCCLGVITFECLSNGTWYLYGSSCTSTYSSCQGGVVPSQGGSAPVTCSYSGRTWSPGARCCQGTSTYECLSNGTWYLYGGSCTSTYSSC